MMRLTVNKQRVVMDESDFSAGNYILSFETNEKTEFRLMSKSGEIVQVI